LSGVVNLKPIERWVAAEPHSRRTKEETKKQIANHRWSKECQLAIGISAFSRPSVFGSLIPIGPNDREQQLPCSRSAFEPNEQNADVCGRDAGNSGSLSNSGWTNLPQFLTGLLPQAGDSGVIKIGWDLFIFEFLELGHLGFLAGNVTGVLQGNLDLLHNFFR